MEVLLKASEAARILGISESSWWKGVKDGCFPAPIKLGKRMTRWRSSDVGRLVMDGTCAPCSMENELRKGPKVLRAAKAEGKDRRPTGA